MQFSSGKFSIEIRKELNYRINSADRPGKYRFKHFSENERSFINSFGVELIGTENSAIVFANGGSTGIHSTSALIDSNHFLVCCGDHVFCLQLPELDINWKLKCDTAACFQILNIGDGYIVHGELEISRIDRLGNIIWQVSGADIFVTPDGSNSFHLTPKDIKATDWQGNTYRIGFDGKIID